MNFLGTTAAALLFGIQRGAAAPLSQPPAFITAPIILGNPTLGVVCSCTDSTYSGSAPVTLTYQWTLDGNPISGATSATYTPVSGDVSGGLRRQDILNNAVGGPITAGGLSSSVAVRGLAPVFTGAPSIIGTPALGVASSCTAGTFTGTAPVTVTYQWTLNGVNISGATSATYTPVSGDDGNTLRRQDILNNPWGGPVTSGGLSAGATVTGIAPAFTSPPVIIGTPTVGVLCSCNASVYTGTAPITVTYQWTRGGASIGGATSAAYIPVTGDIGGTLRRQDTLNNAWGGPITSGGLSSGAVVSAAPAAGAPIILYTDFVAGPTTGGENNKGGYLSLYGLNFGVFSDYGTANHVTIGGVEVDNYRCLIAGVGAGIGNRLMDLTGIQCLRVQVGALGSPTAGVALKIDMTVGGNHPANPTDGSGNYLDYLTKYDNTGNALTFTPQPGAFIFVNRSTGNNANPGTFASPIKDLQTSTGFGGAYKCGTSSSDATNGIKPGTHVIDMGGTANAVGLAGFAAYIFRISGTAPTGAANRGPICFTSYPGAAGANSPVTSVIQGVAVSSSGGGGFISNDQARAGETNPYDGLTGWGRWMHFSNIKIISSANGERDGCPMNLASGSNDWRIVNCDLSWPWVSNSNNITNAAGIAGNGYRVFAAGNYIHNIQGNATDNQNHGMYIDGSVVCANGYVAAFNFIKDITAGNGIQTFNSQAPDSIQNISIHHNWIETVHKHGLNCSDSTQSRADWNNVVLFAGEASYNISTGAVTAASGIRAYNNTFYGFAMVVGTRPAIWNQGGNGGGAASTDFRNNIVSQSASHGATGYSFQSLDSGTNNFSKNRWYDPNGNLTTKPANDSTGSYGIPGFTDVTVKDFSLLTGSACKDAGGSPLVTRSTDFLIHATPFNTTHDIGAFEFGAT